MHKIGEGAFTHLVKKVSILIIVEIPIENKKKRLNIRNQKIDERERYLNIKSIKIHNSIKINNVQRLDRS